VHSADQSMNRRLLLVRLTSHSVVSIDACRQLTAAAHVEIFLSLSLTTAGSEESIRLTPLCRKCIINNYYS